MVHEIRHHLERERRRRKRLEARRSRATAQVNSTGNNTLTKPAINNATFSKDAEVPNETAEVDENASFPKTKSKDLFESDVTHSMAPAIVSQEQKTANQRAEDTEPILRQTKLSPDAVANYFFFRSLRRYPMHTIQSLQDTLLFSLVLFCGVVWSLRKQVRDRQEKKQPKIHNVAVAGAPRAYEGRIRAESNMSSSLDDTSLRSFQPSHRRGRSQSQEFFLSPLLSRKSSIVKSTTRSEMFYNNDWADESEYQQLEHLLQNQHGSLSTTLSGGAASHVTRQDKSHSLDYMTVHHGPKVNDMVYHTWTPPPLWAEAAKRVFPKDVATLRRTLRINVNRQPITLTISDVTGERQKQQAKDPHQRDDEERDGERAKEFRLPLSEFSVHPKPPTDGGVLEVYVKNSPKSEWMEHTFQSCQAAAQFQSDLIAAQVLGPTIQNMYHVFRLIHQGSLAHDGDEYVLHNDRQTNSEGEVLSANGVAWDDVMRCFGSTFPKIRVQLEDLWWNDPAQKSKETSAGAQPGNNPNTPDGEGPQTTAAQDDEGGADGDGGDEFKEDGSAARYFNKRVLLGPVDFFRLFVPTMGPDSKPFTTSDVHRMEQLLRWRKRVARASVLLQSYARARELVNVGWDLGCFIPRDYSKFRLAYDMNTDNQAHDRSQTNEYYEPYVSRDVFCRVRGPRFKKGYNFFGHVFSGRKSRETTMSLGQCFSLVASHTFQMPATRDSRISFDKDPVNSIPSLRRLIAENNKEVDFFVVAVFSRPFEAVVVSVFARSIPVGVDPSFDISWDRFKSGDEKYRKGKLEFMLQLAFTTLRFPLIYSIFLRMLAFFILILDPRSFVAQTGNTITDRYTLPALRLENYGKTHHFGGKGNYASVTVNVDSTSWNTIIGRLLIAMVTVGKLTREIVDVSFKIRGEKEDELPERVISCIRYVQADFLNCQLPTSSAGAIPSQNSSSMVFPRSAPPKQLPNTFLVFLRCLIVDPFIAAMRVVLETFREAVRHSESMTVEESQMVVPAHSQLQSKPSIIATGDPFEKAVNKLIEVLEDVRVPMRVVEDSELKSSILKTGVPWSCSISAGKALQARKDLQQVSILRVVSRSDLKRYFVSSNCSLKKATVRIVESASWRGLTFPVDLRACRVELQTGQFFQQGRDVGGRPVFYFRTMCRGPWRGDEDAVIAAVVHRLEQSLAKFAKEDPDVRCTLIVLLGKPKKRKKKNDEEKEKSSEAESAIGQGSVHSNIDDEDEEAQSSEEETIVETRLTTDPINNSDNPRVSRDEQWFPHINDRLVGRLIQLVMLHYPERLYRCLVVKGQGRGDHTPRTALGGLFTLAGLVDAQNTRRKVKFLGSRSHLQKYIDKAELIDFVGGDCPVDRSAFEI
mmetsp:Transcript_18323/g.42793  ORF Transcript_18323/g.42793 Transcript_18323/m.42793 type:complete len:1369 (-) Transcript_18323:3041-7147(-)